LETKRNTQTPRVGALADLAQPLDFMLPYAAVGIVPVAVARVVDNLATRADRAPGVRLVSIFHRAGFAKRRRARARCGGSPEHGNSW
jgi:hypothetical protein